MAKKTTPTPDPVPDPAETTTPDPADTGTVIEQPHPPVPAGRLRAAVRDTPELLAIIAVRQLGAAVVRHVSWLRDRYPVATPDQLAAMVTRRFLRQAGSRRAVAALAGLGGPLGALAGAGGVAWLEARLALEVAAAYGHDPADPRRAADLLVLWGRSPTTGLAYATAETALRSWTSGRHLPDAGQPSDAGQPTGTRDNAPWRVLAGWIARRGAARAASRLLPGAGLVLDAATDQYGTRRFADRVLRYYGQPAATRP